MNLVTSALHQLSVLDGHRPHLRDAENRRLVDSESYANASLKEIVPLETAFLRSGGRCTDEYYETSRGLHLFARTLVPGTGVEKRGAVLVCHGYSTHLRFQHKRTMLEYASRGFVTTGVEYEGHGWSDGVLGLVKDADAMLDDVEEFLRRQQSAFADLDWLVHGESLGGMVALNMCLRAQEKQDMRGIAGAVLVAPMCKIAEEVQPPQVAQDALIFVSRFVPELSVTPSKISPKVVFKQPHMAQVFANDPLRYSGRPRLATAREFFRKTQELEKRIPDIRTPFFVIHGKEDIVTTWEASQELYDDSQLVPPEDKEMVIVEDAWHGLMWAEDEKEEYWTRMMTWVENRL